MLKTAFKWILILMVSWTYNYSSLEYFISSFRYHLSPELQELTCEDFEKEESKNEDRKADYTLIRLVCATTVMSDSYTPYHNTHLHPRTSSAYTDEVFSPPEV